jgi:hypothetical protein
MDCTAGWGWRCGIPLSPGIGSPPSSQHFCHFNKPALEHISHLFKTPWPALGPTQPPLQWVPWFSPWTKGWDVKLTTILYLVPCLGMGGVIPPLLKYAITAGTRKPLLSYRIVVHQDEKFLVVSVHRTGRFTIVMTTATGPNPQPDCARPRSKLPCARHGDLL